MPRIHGKQSASWWGALAPAVGPTGTATTYVGAVLQFTVPGRVAGMRFWDGAGPSPFTTYMMLIDDSDAPGTYKAIRAIRVPANTNPQWHQLWFHPWLRVDLTRTYWVVALYVGGGFFRNNTALAGGAITRNGIKFVSSFQSTALDLSNAVPVTNTNTNAVDVLFQPD